MISPVFFNTLNSQKAKKIGFQSRKTLYTDFDGTYFPYIRDDIKPENESDFKRMYEPFDAFQKQSNGDSSIIVTTGRSKNDFLHTISKFLTQSLPFSVPKALISSNGANEFSIDDTKMELISVYPPYDFKMEGALDGILAFLQEKNKDASFIEVQINGDKDTYQDYSSESVLDTVPLNKKGKYISVARDGRYNAEFVVSKKICFKKIQDEVREYIIKNNLPYSIECYENAKYTLGFEYNKDRKTKVPANTIFLKYTNGSVQPDKYDIIKKQVQNILETDSNDIVIVAGDGFNDEKMLNPFSYLDLVYDGEIDLDNPDVLNSLKKLPIRSIICGENPELDNLRKIASELNSKGVDIIQCAPNPKVDYINLVQQYSQQANLNEISVLLGSEGKSEAERKASGEKLAVELNKLYALPQNAKREFIRQYCNITGFPDMREISSRINSEVIKALQIAQEKTGAKVLFAGCNPTCSISNGHALPGSDLDTLFILLRDEDNTSEFKQEFKQATNSLLVGATYNRTNDMPDVVKLGDIKASLSLAQEIFNQHGLNKNSALYESNINQIIRDWTIAGQYNSDINRFIPEEKEGTDETRTRLLRTGMLMEIIRDGNVFSDDLDLETREFFENSCVYKYSNMQQMHSYKLAPLKQKHKNREEILSRFNDLSVDEQLDMIVNIIRIFNKYNKKDVDEKYNCLFMDSGCGNMEDLIQPLLSPQHRIK